MEPMCKPNYDYSQTLWMKMYLAEPDFELRRSKVYITFRQALDIIRENPSFAATNYTLYPDSINYPMTPAPAGKHPFYISHDGRHGSR